MKIFLDTVNLEDIRKYDCYGLIDGITTNPTLMSMSNKSFAEIAQELCESIEGDVSLEVGAIDYEGMIKEGNKISNIAPNAVVKLPTTFDGVKACQYFAKAGIKVNMTLCFSAIQAMIAARAGATYISPFIGRLEDIKQDGIGLIADIRNIYDRFSLKTMVLAASIRNLDHITQAALYGADCATIPVKLMEILLDHELTKKGLENFSEDWIKSGKNIL